MIGWKNVLFMITALTIATGSEARRTYVIEQGDTPGEIASKLAPSLEELRAANPTVNFSLLRVGAEVIDPRPEFADIKKAEQQITDLTEKLGAIVAGRNTLIRELSASRGLNVTFDEKVRELQPLANEAESYRDRFWGWVSGFAGMCAFLLVIIAMQARTRFLLDRKIFDLQQEVVYARIDSMMVLAASRSSGASSLRCADDADLVTQHTH